MQQSCLNLQALVQRRFPRHCSPDSSADALPPIPAIPNPQGPKDFEASAEPSFASLSASSHRAKALHTLRFPDPKEESYGQAGFKRLAWHRTSHLIGSQL